MAWRHLTIDDLRQRATDSEISAIEAAGEADAYGDNDKVQGSLDQAAAQTRGYIGGCQVNIPLGPGLSIPDELRAATISIARHFLAASVPNYTEAQGEYRATEYSDAVRIIREDLPAGKIAIVADGGTEGSPTLVVPLGGSATKLDFSM